MARQLDRAPDRLVRRLRLQPLELPLQPLRLAVDALAHAQSLIRRERYARCSLRGTIASRCPKRRFCSARPKSSGSFSRVVCCTTRGPVNAISAPGSAIVTSPSEANEARTPAVVG